MIKKLFLMVSISLFVFLCSCEDLNRGKGPIPGYEYESVSTESIAQALAYLNPDNDICNEVYFAVKTSVALGLDESYYFSEALGDCEKITKTTDVERCLQSKLASLPTGNSIKELFSLVANNTDMQNNYQIYWPYSKNWNGKEQPTLTFQTSPTTPQNENIGYKVENDQIKEVIVNEEYAKKHPVWIINYNPIPYYEYPDFAKQNWVCTDGQKYHKSIESRIYIYSRSATKGSFSESSRPNYVLSRYDIDFKSDKDTLSIFLKDVTFKQKDKTLNNFFSGGSHYVYNINVVDNNDINPNTTSIKDFEWGVPSEIISVRFVFLRSEMKQNTTKIIDSLISWRWLKHEEHMPVGLIQEFGGKYKDFVSDCCINFTFDPPILRPDGIYFTGVDFYGMIPYNENDKIIFSGICERNQGFYIVGQSGENISCTLGLTKGSSIPIWKDSMK